MDENINHVELYEEEHVITDRSKLMLKLPADWNDIYKYYCYGKFSVYIITQILNILTLVFITVIFFYLFTIKWGELLSCPSELQINSCLNLSEYRANTLEVS